MDTELAIGLKLNRFDLEQCRNEHLFALPARVSQWITINILREKEEKNIFIVYVMVNVLLTTIPLAVSLYLLEGRLPDIVLSFLGLGYLLFNILIHARSFILALHYSTHTPIFNRKWKFLNHINTTILCNFFGIPLWTYYAHHIAMHHCENNVMPHDVSSTMPYQRDSKLEHLKYMLRYVFLIWVELPYHLIQQKRHKVAHRCLMGAITFFISVFYLFQLRPIATLFVFILPTIILSFALMEGNWKQHIFVDPDDPENVYRSSYACINTPTNALNFNDGYHVEHHKNPAMPWHQLPTYFQSQIKHYVEQDGFIFTNIGSGQVGRLVLNGQLEQLAEHYVNVGQKKRTKEELVKEFKRRLQPITSMPGKST
ncbi:MAG: fatty acid desaturase [Oscillatoriales cyanobacterium C42_A2020_001]|nr:fatty acid desaturase [Leptolyngbyaceae cyanobacterium C42_A2020_001]